MRRLPSRVTTGVIVATAGVLLLLDAAGLVRTQPILWAVLLGTAGAALWHLFFTHRSAWWAAIPGAGLTGTAVVTVMDVDPGLVPWTGVPFFAALSVGFWAVYSRDNHRWWTLMLAGVLLTLSVVTAVATAVGGPITGAILLSGNSLTSASVAVLPGAA